MAIRFAQIEKPTTKKRRAAEKVGSTTPARRTKAEAAQIEKSDVEKRAGRPAAGKTAVKIRLDNDVIDQCKSLGDGWQTVINGILRNHFSIYGVQNSKCPPGER